MFYRFIFLILIASISMDFSTCYANRVLLERLEADNPKAREVSRLLKEYKSKDQVYKVVCLYKEFIDLNTFPEAEFDGVCVRTGIPKRADQSDKQAIASFLFLTTALDDEHLLLIKQCFEPLTQLYRKADQHLHWQDACTTVMENIDRVVADHAYFRNRYTLFALAVASKFDNKLAHLILLSAIRHVILKEEDHIIIERGKSYVLPLLGTEANFPDFYGVLNTLPGIESLDETVLPHSYVLRGREKVATGDLLGASKDFKTAGQMRDFEGYTEMIKNIPVTSADRKGLIFSAFWMGDETLYEHLDQDMKEKFRPDRRIFPPLKKFITR